MVIKRRIETQEAKALRDERQHHAAPGGSHDRLVGWLAKGLPMAVGILAAIMVITPLSPRGEVSFLLDRNKVAIIKERLRVDNAMYRGQDNRGRPFSLTAGEAVQQSNREGIVRLTDLVAGLAMEDGPARLTAGAAQYDIDRETVSVAGPLRMTSADGFSLEASNVSINLNTRKLRGAGGVEGTIPSGTFRANRLYADLIDRIVILEGNARLRMVPGRLRMPQ